MKTKMMIALGAALVGMNGFAQGIGSPIYFCAPSKMQLSLEQIQAKKDRLVILNYKNGIKVVGYGKLKASSSSQYKEKQIQGDDRITYVNTKGDKIEIIYDSDFGSKAATAYLGGKKVDLQCITN